MVEYVNEHVEQHGRLSALAELGVEAARPSAAAAHHHPLPLPVFQDHLKATYGRRQELQAKFLKDSGTIKAGAGFPSSVVYHTCCGALCKTVTAPDVLEMQAKITHCMVRFISAHFKSPAAVCKQDLLFAVELCKNDDDEEIAQVLFVKLVAAVGRSGRFEAYQLYAPCDLLAGVAVKPYNDLLLQLQTESIPYSGGGSGSRFASASRAFDGTSLTIVTPDIDFFSAMLLKSCGDGDCPTNPARAWARPYAPIYEQTCSHQHYGP